MRVSVHGEVIGKVRTRSVEWVLALLTLRHGKPTERSWLAGTLWPESDERQALQNLRNDLVALRKALGAESYRIQSPTRDTLVFDAAGADIDVTTFDALIEWEDQESLVRAVSLYRGPLLEGCNESWITSDRERRFQQCTTALESLARIAATRDDLEAAIGWLRQARELDPLRESTVQQLMRLLAASGETAAAVEVFWQYRNQLDDELSLSPSAETTRLFQDIRSPVPVTTRGSGRPVASPPTKSPGSTAALPHPIARLIGRDDDVRDLRSEFERHRLITLIGSGGVGKTRLSIELAAALEDRLDLKPIWVELAPIADEDRVLSAVARALEIPPKADVDAQALESQVVARLAGGSALLVIDNCEHLLDSVAMVVQSLLSRCGELRILATSRQRLGLVGEFAWRVPSLAIPDLSPENGSAVTLDAAIAFPSVRLFVERATAANRDFRLDSAEDLLAICQICQRLDGIPLAIELAAARASVLPVRQIAARLDDRFRLLSSDNRAVLPRQRTLKALIDWSYAALSTEEQAMLRRVSVFTGGWSLAAAEAVGLDDADVLRLLSSLVDKSLVNCDLRSVEARYSMLETVQQYAAAELRASGEQLEAQDAHLAYVIAIAEEARKFTYLPERVEHVARLKLEQFNIASALSYAATAASPAPYLRLTSALRLFWSTRGEHRVGIGHLQAALAKNPDASATDRSRALVTAASLCEAAALVPEARELAELARPLLDESGDKWWQAERFRTLSLAASWHGHDAEAADCAHQSQLLFEAAGDELMAGLAMLHRGRAMLGGDDPLFARALVAESLAISRRAQNETGIAEAVHTLAQIAGGGNDYQTACDLLVETVDIQRRLDRPFGVAWALEQLGLYEHRLGRTESPTIHLEAAASIWRETGMGSFLKRTLQIMAMVNGDNGNPELAARQLVEAEAL